MQQLGKMVQGFYRQYGCGFEDLIRLTDENGKSAVSAVRRLADGCPGQRPG